MNEEGEMNSSLDMFEKVKLGLGRNVLAIVVLMMMLGIFISTGIVVNMYTVIAGVVMIIIPITMSIVLASEDRKYEKDFVAGFRWYLLWVVFLLGMVFWENDLALQGVETKEWYLTEMNIMSSMMFAFGVIRYYTSFSDLVTPGVGILGGLSKLEHPHRKLLVVMLFGGLPLFLGAILLSK